MKEKNCYIIGAGPCDRLCLQVKAADFVIAADGGYRYLEHTRIDLAIGDFDSLPELPTACPVIRLKPKKDDTDMLAAMKEGLKRGYKLFHIYGGVGGRVDHSIANLQNLAWLCAHGGRGFLYTEDQVITMLQNESICFSERAEGYVSVFSFGEQACKVSLQGLKYPLKEQDLDNAFPLGVSNEFIHGSSKITVKRGRLLVVFPKTCISELQTGIELSAGAG